MAKDSLTATRRTADVAEAPANPLDATAAVAAWHEFAMLGAKTMSEGLAQGLSTWSAVAAEAGKAAAPPPPRPPVNPFLAWMEVWQSAVMPLPAPVNPWSAWLSLWPTPASKTAGSFPMPGFPGVFNPLTAANPFLSAFNSMPAKWPMQAGWSMGPTGPVWSPLAAAWPMATTFAQPALFDPMQSIMALWSFWAKHSLAPKPPAPTTADWSSAYRSSGGHAVAPMLDPAAVATSMLSWWVVPADKR